MDTVIAVYDDFMFRGRILRREWKRGPPVSHPLYYPTPFIGPCSSHNDRVASSEIHFLARARAGSCPSPTVHLSKLWLLERIYSFVSLVQMDIS
jgi:hypothetical protein